MEANGTTAQDVGCAYPQTHWTTIFDTGSRNPDRARAALDKLCGLYRQPMVNWFGRHADKQEAEDLAHSFMIYLLDKRLLSRLTERRDRFRCFLVACMR